MHWIIEEYVMVSCTLEQTYISSNSTWHMRSLADAEITGFGGHRKSTRTILSIEIITPCYWMTLNQQLCSLHLKVWAFTSCQVCCKEIPREIKWCCWMYRLYVSECFFASKGGVPYKNSKQRIPRLHTSTPASCSLPSTATWDVIQESATRIRAQTQTNTWI